MDPRVTELHCIMPIANMASVLEHGILCYERAARLDHTSVAMQPVQERRDQTQVPQGLRLHQYANLYFNARNPMLYKRREEAGSLCVISVSRKVLAIEHVVITDRNAASNYVRFLDASQWPFVSFDDIFSDSWLHLDDERRYYEHKSRRCAEVLVPRCVPQSFLRGAYVVDRAAQARLRESAPDFPVRIDPVLFFRTNQ